MTSILERKGLIAGIIIVTAGIIAAYIFSPWSKPELTEPAVIFRISEDGSCQVETYSQHILNVWDCKGYAIDNEVIIKYREGTSLAEIISNKGP